MVVGCKLTKFDDSPYVDQTRYRFMIGSFLYLTTLRPNIMQVLCLVAHFQSLPKESHVNVVKRNFKYI